MYNLVLRNLLHYDLLDPTPAESESGNAASLRHITGKHVAESAVGSWSRSDFTASESPTGSDSYGSLNSDPESTKQSDSVIADSQKLNSENATENSNNNSVRSESAVVSCTDFGGERSGNCVVNMDATSNSVGEQSTSLSSQRTSEPECCVLSAANVEEMSVIMSNGHLSDADRLSLCDDSEVEVHDAFRLQREIGSEVPIQQIVYMLVLFFICMD